MEVYFWDKYQKEVEKPEEAPVTWRPSVYGYCEENGKVLMITAPGNVVWELPGGGMEIDETPHEALEREFFEETGYKVKVQDQNPIHVGIENFYWKSRDSYHIALILIYSVKIRKDIERDISIINTIDGDEVEKVEWVALEDLNDENTIRFIKPFIQRLKSNK
ncbi:NUDIX hydrolase [Patescibacteria group bacterium]|nr:NUDIX hydrolase [Patescibacteria group bacterium]MBU1906650.1 NUDIX hydrolase [Patescibacteria group bacterium]